MNPKKRRGGLREDVREYGTQTVFMTIDELMAHLRRISQKCESVPTSTDRQTINVWSEKRAE